MSEHHDEMLTGMCFEILGTVESFRVLFVGINNEGLTLRSKPHLATR